MTWVYIGLAALLLVTGVVIYKAVAPQSPDQIVEEDLEPTPMPVDSSVKVNLSKSRTKDNSVIISVSGLAGKYVSIAYELTYDSLGLIKGVNSGSKPIDISRQSSFEREIYLGTCSRNVCTADKGVKAVSLVLEFVDPAGLKSQFVSDYDL